MIETLFNFEGRLRRSTFWLANIGTSLAVGVAATFLFLLTGGAGRYEPFGFSPFAMLFLIPVWGVSLWIALALGVKRCHDHGYPGVMILLEFVPLLGTLWALIDLGFIDGTPGPNAYGPSPKGYAAVTFT